MLHAELERAAAGVGIDVPLVVAGRAAVVDGLVVGGAGGGSHHAPGRTVPLVQVQVVVLTGRATQDAGLGAGGGGLVVSVVRLVHVVALGDAAAEAGVASRTAARRAHRLALSGGVGGTAAVARVEGERVATREAGSRRVGEGTRGGVGDAHRTVRRVGHDREGQRTGARGRERAVDG